MVCGCAAAAGARAALAPGLPCATTFAPPACVVMCVCVCVCVVVWCGVVWCGVVWCGVAWCGVAWWWRACVRVRALNACVNVCAHACACRQEGRMAELEDDEEVRHSFGVGRQKKKIGRHACGVRLRGTCFYLYIVYWN